MTSDFTSSKDVVEVLTFPPSNSIIGLPIVVDVVIGFNPLEHLQIVLVLCLNQLVDIDVPLDLVLGKRLLQNLVVLDEFIVMLCAPFHFGQRNSSGIASVNDLAVKGSSSALFNL